MDAIVFSISFACAAAVVFLLSKPFDNRVHTAFALACAVYLGVDDFVTSLPSIFKQLDVFGERWNWNGKLLSLALSGLSMVAFKLSPATVGLTFKQRHPQIGLIALVLFIVWGASLGLLFEPGAPDVETLAFQATMPALSEELVYRGIVPALLLGMIRRRGPIDGIPWAVILVSSAVFGICHGLQYSEGQFGFDVLSALFPFIGSIPGGWLRFKTGSLLIPVLAHSFANVAFHVAGGMAT